MKNPPKARIVVLDEQPMLRYGISVYLNSQPDMIVCGEADSIPEARSKISECNPHLLMTAFRLGIGDSLEFIKALKAERPELLVLVYAAFKQSIFAEWALRAGANGYLMKTAAKEELPIAIREILRGRIYISRDLATREFQELLGTLKRTRPSQDLPAIDDLSGREMHVFMLIGSGLDTNKVAHSMRMRMKTIESHRESIKRKLGLNSDPQLVKRAVKFAEENFLPQKAKSRGEESRP